MPLTNRGRCGSSNGISILLVLLRVNGLSGHLSSGLRDRRLVPLRAVFATEVVTRELGLSVATLQRRVGNMYMYDLRIVV